MKLLFFLLIFGLLPIFLVDEAVTAYQLGDAEMATVLLMLAGVPYMVLTGLLLYTAFWCSK